MRTIRLGGICADFSCAKCCKNTKMLLSQNDIKSIVNLGYNENDFCFLDSDGFYKLKNVDGVCFFLHNNRCKIYPNRPQGCRFYPIIFDLNINKAILDDDCPLINTIHSKTTQNFNKDLKKFTSILINEKEMR